MRTKSTQKFATIAHENLDPGKLKLYCHVFIGNPLILLWHAYTGFSISFSSAGQIPNSKPSRGFGHILAIQKEPVVTFSTGPKLISRSRFCRWPPLIENTA